MLTLFTPIIIKKMVTMTLTIIRFVSAFALSALLAGCGDSANQQDNADTVTTAVSKTDPAGRTDNYNEDRNAYFGDLHVHTMYSFDAFIFGTTSSPDDAYDFAKGGVIRHPGGFDMQLKEPLDFYGVSDHAFYLGSMRSMATPGTALSKMELAKGMDKLSDGAQRRAKFEEFLVFLGSDRRKEILNPQVFKDAWDDIIGAANRANDPGKFTAFIAYEYTSSGPDNANLHRNVIFKGDTAPNLPFSRLDSLNPEDLWDWMDKKRDEGHESLAIPHNSNGSNGMMFQTTTFEGDALSAAYAEQRMRNEPLVEISQVKGTSDTHPALSPNDEWADFEIMPYRIATNLDSAINGSYVREALMNGLKLQDEENYNPFKFGIIGSSDTHNASYAGDEDNYWSKVGVVDDTPQKRGSVKLDEPNAEGGDYALNKSYKTWSAAGLAGVWAQENTRDSIYDAFRRKETFGTSGPRIKVRFFAGYDIPALDDEDLLKKAYNNTTMGGDLEATATDKPKFLVLAARDAHSAPLQRIQIVKASMQKGEPVEEVFDVACGDGNSVDPETNRCPDNGAMVDLTDCSYSQDKGSAELRSVWQDPSYDATQRAMYYVRVLENPVCRWSTWDALRAGVEPRADLHKTIQERAWSSPIWVTPLAGH
jgi:hypothetical protein